MSGLSNHYDTMSFIKSVIDGLSLSGLTGGTIIQEVPDWQGQGITLPFISIAPWGSEELNQIDGFNDRDDVDYPTAVTIFGRIDAASFEQRLGWRQSIRRNLNNRKVTGSFPGVVYNWNLICKPGAIVTPDLLFDQICFASSMTIIAKYQEPRS